ncbi:MAG: hypothetical protein ABWY18_01460, partial [Tardiphaga sp.]
DRATRLPTSAKAVYEQQLWPCAALNMMHLVPLELLQTPTRQIGLWAIDQPSLFLRAWFGQRGAIRGHRRALPADASKAA